MSIRPTARAWAVMKTSDQTFWVRSESRWLPRAWGAPPSRCGLTKADAESLLEAAQKNGLVAQVVPLY